MRRIPVALAGASLVAVGLVIPAAFGSTPSSSNLTVPASPNQTAHVHWTGTIPPGANSSNDCSKGNIALSDQHTLNVTAPVYDGLKAVFTIAIDWTPSGVPESDDEIVTLLAPDGTPIGSADNGAIGAPGETLQVTDLVSGKYTVLACGFTNAAPKDYTGDVTVKTAAAPKLRAPGGGNNSTNDDLLRFAPATVVDPILFGGEPGFTFDPTADGSR